MKSLFKWHEKMVWKFSKKYNFSKYQVLIFTWLEGILIGVVLCKFIF